MFGTIILILLALAILKSGVGDKIVVLVLLLLMVKFIIGWDDYWDGALPNPFGFTIGDFLKDFFVDRLGRFLDFRLGTNIFSPFFNYILGALFYIPLFMTILYFFGKWMVDSMDSEQAAGIMILWMIAFTCVYYFKFLDSLPLVHYVTMPNYVTTQLKSYYWIAIAISVFEIKMNFIK